MPQGRSSISYHDSEWKSAKTSGKEEFANTPSQKNSNVPMNVLQTNATDHTAINIEIQLTNSLQTLVSRVDSIEHRFGNQLNLIQTAINVIQASINRIEKKIDTLAETDDI
jgi:hypothetical protein